MSAPLANFALTQLLYLRQELLEIPTATRFLCHPQKQTSLLETYAIRPMETVATKEFVYQVCVRPTTQLALNAHLIWTVLSKLTAT